MGESFLDKNGGGFDVNGIIKDYYVYAGENINAGSFVEFINGVAGQTTEESVNTVLDSSTYTGSHISAVKLTDSKVFVAHSDSTTNYCVYGMVITINGATISCGVDTAISGQKNGATQLAAVRLSDDKVFVAHEYGTYYHYGIVCTISGTTITCGTDTKITNNSSSRSVIGKNLVLLENGNLFLSHGYGDNEYLYGAVIVIDGTTITIGADTKLSSTSDTGCMSCSALLSDNRVFVVHYYSHEPYGIIVTINGTAISKGTDVQLSSAGYLGNQYGFSIIPLSNGNVFVTYQLTNLRAELCGTVCTVSGTSITAGSHTQLSTEYRSGFHVDSFLLANGKVLIAHSYGESHQLYGMMVTINGTTITAGTDMQLSSSSYSGCVLSAVLMSDNLLFIAHSDTDGSYYLHGQVFGIMNDIVSNNIVLTECETQVRNVTSSNANGIAKTRGVGGDSTGHNEQVKVYVPDM